MSEDLGACKAILVMSAKADFDNMTEEDKAAVALEWKQFVESLVHQQGNIVSYVFSVVYQDPSIDGMSGRTAVGGSGHTLMFLEDSLHEDVANKLEASEVCTCNNCRQATIMALIRQYTAKEKPSKIVSPAPERHQ